MRTRGANFRPGSPGSAVVTHQQALGHETEGRVCPAFVARPGMVLDPLAERPDVVGADLREVADQILERER
jgi:2-haloacid dehalogenase